MTPEEIGRKLWEFHFPHRKYVPAGVNQPTREAFAAAGMFALDLIGHDEDSDAWQEAGRAVVDGVDGLLSARTLQEQADATVGLYNANSDLKSWLPGWDWEAGVFRDAPG